ncbi:alkaline phosphatase family protein [Bailinhaonella thermotolerans]|uniref:Alkaline phosphatase family protein n=1 Tax=Bailinhaonella thermotolerans TaxID=1070861 RepID=A0A3A4B827_9ACTN|nr:nucleotide pyrophosphatase/phosphodiesterase family protein [Bailinhaonella thermotolerans]RJL34391.1 alkaline phosphatase family protein [Bailinhaonella thermotolerans]
MTAPPPPRYGEGALPDLTPSVLAALGVPGETGVLGLAPVRRACVLLLDGVGAELLRRHPEAAPYLSSLPGRTLTAGFPATTATSLGSLGTGLPPGGHGMLGYQVAVPGEARLLNCLRWSSAVDPLTWQPAPTVFERAEAAGIAASYVGPGEFAGSGLTRAVYRGARYLPAADVDQRVAAARSALSDGPAFALVYFGDVDTVGHLTGTGSPEWLEALATADTLAMRIAETLPPGSALYVTADHGMVDVADRVDVDETPALRDGVRLLGGDPRSRHVYCEPGVAEAVLQTWSELLAGRAWVRSREEAVESGWFGPLSPDMAPRVGDVVVAAYGDCGVIASRAEPLESSLVGMHGSLTAEEQHIPLLEHSTR